MYDADLLPTNTNPEDLEKINQIRQYLKKSDWADPGHSNRFHYTTDDDGYVKELLYQGGPHEEIPDAIFNLHKLKSLRIDGFPLTKPPDKFDHLSELRSLDIHLDTIETPPSIFNIPNLVNLTIKSPMFTLPDEIANLKKLQKIELSLYNMRKLPDSFCDLKSLTRLTFSNCTQLTWLPQRFGNLINLEEFTTRNSRLFDLPDSFCKLRNLKELVIEDRDLYDLPDEFGNLTNLQFLKLLTPRLKELPYSFHKLPNLDYIIFNECNQLVIPDNFYKLPKLKSIYIYDCVGMHIPDSFANLPSLNYLEFNGSVPDVPVTIPQLIPNVKISFRLSHIKSKEEFYEYLNKEKLSYIRIHNKRKPEPPERSHYF